ncbi:MAG: glycoside hydrolase family 3 N-terminal domain-containing protein [Solirubrobacterales bacterium]
MTGRVMSRVWIAVLVAAAIVSTTAWLASGAGGRERADRPAAVDRLSTPQLVGQRVIVSYEGLEPPDALLELIREGKAAGVIFFGHNIANRTQSANVIAELQSAAEHAVLPRPLRRPLLLMTDQEGGIVRRIPGPPGMTEQQIGESPRSRLLAKQAGRAAGRTLAGVGVNVNLAPVLGVLSGQDNFLQMFGRIYSTHHRKVSRLGGAFIAAQQRQGVAATSKHFPGLGAAGSTDTDTAPVTLDLSRRTLRDVDEFPYEKAIAEGTRLVMIANATYPALDPARPASLSRPVIRGQLRRDLGFRGVTITDALEAGGLEDFGPIPHRGVLAARAGADLLLFSEQEIDEGLAGYRELRETYQGGSMNEATFEGSVRRVLRLRKALEKGERLPPP